MTYSELVALANRCEDAGLYALAEHYWNLAEVRG